MDAVRIGTLGAARIAPQALIRPARETREAEVVGVAARDPQRARAFAAKHGIPRAHASYEELIADPDVDAIYNPLPNSLHAEWTRRAVAAGKHVLCEKPFTSNATEAEQVAAAAEGTGLVVMEAFHYRYHPLARRIHDLVAASELGPLRHVEAVACIPLPRFGDIRYRYDLAGGATMDIGCYAVHQLRLAGGDEPRVTAARAKLHSPRIDRWMQADVRWPEGHTGRVTCSLWSASLLKMSLRAVGERGEVRVLNPTAPQFFHRFSLRINGRRTRERFPRRPTYAYQLEAFTDAILRGTPVLTPPSDAVQNMRVIDAIYSAAGLPVRGEPAQP